MDTAEVGRRVRRLRLLADLDQLEFAGKIGIATGSVSKIESGRMVVDGDLAAALGRVVDCSPAFLTAQRGTVLSSRPWLRAYADASQRVVDRQVADCLTLVEVAEQLGLRRLPDTLPLYDADLNDDHAIQQYAMEVRAAAQLAPGDVVGNSIRAAERLGCIVLPMSSELGRHLGMSLRADMTAVISVSRPSDDPDHQVPGDRQRHTVAHELGHLGLHSSTAPPQTAEDASRIERQASLFAGAFLTPGDAMLEELESLGGRVTLSTLQQIKGRWGVAIKALVMRFRQLGVINDDAARSLYKQISARGWNKSEPVPVGNEEAVWLRKSLSAWAGSPDTVGEAVAATGIGRSHFDRWLQWSPTQAAHDADVVDLAARRRGSATPAPRRALPKR